MTEQELTRDLRSFVGNSGTINVSQVAKYMNCSRDTARVILKRLIAKEEYIQAGKLDKKFFVKDVAREIMATRGASND